MNAKYSELCPAHPEMSMFPTKLLRRFSEPAVISASWTKLHPDASVKPNSWLEMHWAPTVQEGRQRMQMVPPTCAAHPLFCLVWFPGWDTFYAQVFWLIRWLILFNLEHHFPSDRPCFVWIWDKSSSSLWEAWDGTYLCTALRSIPWPWGPRVWPYTRLGCPLMPNFREIGSVWGRVTLGTPIWGFQARWPLKCRALVFAQNPHY